MPASTASIWLPGRGVTDIQERRVDIAVKEYDEDLRFGRNEETNQYCVFLCRGGDAPLPILGFNKIPHPEDALKALYATDSLRHGEQILDDINRHNESIEKAKEYAADEASSQAAEGFEWLMRDQGQTPYFKSYDISHKRNKMGGYS